MPSDSRQAAPTTPFIPNQEPGPVRQRRRRKPHPKSYVSNPRPGTLEQSSTYRPTEYPDVPPSYTPEAASPPQHQNMRIPFTEGEEIRLNIPQSARIQRESLGEDELKSFGGPLRTRRSPSSGERPQRGESQRRGVLASPAHKAEGFRFPLSSAPSNSYMSQQSAQASSYNMQAPAHQQQREELGGSRYVMHREASSHLGAHRDAHHNMTSSFQDARAFESQRAHANSAAPSIPDAQHNVNQQPSYPAPRYAVEGPLNYGPDLRQTETQAPYDDVYISRHPTEGWSQPERRTDDTEAHQAYPMRQPSQHQQAQHWQVQALPPNAMYPVYVPQQPASAGPVRHAQQQFQHHQRAQSLVSQPYPVSNDGTQTRAISLSGMHSRHASMPSHGESRHNLPSSPGAIFTQSPTTLPLGSNPLGIGYAGQPADSRSQAMSFSPIPRPYNIVQGQAQPPIQYLQSPARAPIGIQYARDRRSSLGLPAGLERFGSPEGTGDPNLKRLQHANLGTQTIAEASSLQTSTSGFQAPLSHLGGQAEPESSSALSSPYVSHAGPAVHASASESPSLPHAPEPAHSGRRERRKDPRPHKCQECGKGFPRPSALATHMSVHSGDKPYNCPVVSCNKSFAVRSNARRHLKTHGIKLKTRDRGGKTAAPQASKDQYAGSSADDDENENGTDDDAEMEPSAPSTFRRRISTIPVNTLANPPDKGLGQASHRGHANPHSNVHVDPFGLGTSLSLIKGDDADTVLERVKRRRSDSKRNRWEMEMSGGVKLRTVRKGVATGRSRRGLRSEGVDTATRGNADGDETVQEDEEEGDTVHELEEDALLRLCPEREEPTTPQMPQLDKVDLDKLIAPPLAWDGFQKQKMIQESGQNLTLDQRLAFLSGTGGPTDLPHHSGLSSAPQENQRANAPLVSGVLHGAMQSMATTDASLSVLQSSPSIQGDSLADAQQVQDGTLPTIDASPTQTRVGAAPTISFLPWTINGGGAGSDHRPHVSSFHTSSVRTSAGPPARVASVFRGPAREAASGVVDSTRNTPPPPVFHSGIGSLSPPSSGSGSSEEAVGSLRENGSWAPASMNDYVNFGRLRNSEPFDDIGLSSVELQIPLPAVQPRQIHLPDGGGKYDERNSYAPEIGSYPYHPACFNHRPVLAGPAPLPYIASATPWRSSITT